MFRRCFSLACGLGALLVGAAGPSLQAQTVTYTWTGWGDREDWDLSSNWQGGTVPLDDLANSRVVIGPNAPWEIYYYEFFLNQLRIEGLKRSLELQGAYETAHLGSGGLIYAPALPVRSYFDDTIQLRASQTWDIQSGTLEIGGSINDFYLIGETMGSGLHTITKTGAGTLVLENGYSSNWSGGLTLSAGRVEIYGEQGYYNEPVPTNALGFGPLTFNGGTLVAREEPHFYYGEDTVILQIPLVSNGLISTINHATLRFEQPLESSAELTLAANTTIASQGRPLILDLPITESGGARKLTVNSDGIVILQGSSGWTGGTEVTKGALIFAGEDNTPGTTGGIRVGSAGYVGITVDQNVGGFLGEIDKVNSTGTLGFDSFGSEPPDFTSPINLSGFNSQIRLGSATEGILAAAAVITPQGNSYRFGGGGGYLEVHSPLTNAAGPVVRDVVLDSPAERPLLVRFSSASNSFTGGVTATHSGASFDRTALPATGTLTLGTGGYIGLDNPAGNPGPNPAQDFINRFATSTDRGMIGFDGYIVNGSVTTNLSLAGFADSSPGIYLGSSTLAVLSGTITPQGNTYRFGGYSGGILEVTSALTNAPDTSLRAVHIGDPASTATMGRLSTGQYSTVYLSGNNTYGGTTTLYTGQLHVGQTNGVVGTDPTTALGTGALIVQPHTLTLPAGPEVFRPQLILNDSVILPNAIQLNADLNLSGDETSYTLAGVISGTGQLFIDAAYSLISLSGNNTFSGGIYLGGNTNDLRLKSDTAAGTGPLGFGGGSGQAVYFETAAPVIGGLSSKYEDDYAYLYAAAPNTILTINQAGHSRFEGEFRSQDLGDALRLVKSGPGTLYLDGGGLYVHHGVAGTALPGNPEVSVEVRGGTLVINDFFYIEDSAPTFWVNGGTLAVDDWAHIHNPVVISNGRLAGDGYFANATIGAGAILSPGLAAIDIGYGNVGGDPIGELAFGDLTLGGGGLLEWNLIGADTGDGVSDHVSIFNTTTLTITATTTEKFTLKLITLAPDGTPGTVNGFSGNRSYTWTIFDASGSSIVGFDPAKFLIDTSLFSADLPTSTFSLAQNGNLIQLTFQPVPEPSTYALLAIGLGWIGLTLWRRRRA